MTDTRTNTYVYEHAWEPERLRLTSLEEELDPGTFRHLDALGVGPGWRCWEVAAGNGSVARWLAGRVGTAGHVLATDIDTRYLDDDPQPNIEIRRHDLLVDPPPDARFDLVHVRCLLCWLPTPHDILARLARAVRPGGWLVVEEPDLATIYHASEPTTFRKVVTATLRAAEAMSGGSFEYGRRLFDDLRAQGLTEVEAEGRMQVIRGDRPAAAAGFVRLSVERIRDHLVAAGVVTEAEVDETMTLLRDSAFATVFMVTVAAWGRRLA